MTYAQLIGKHARLRRELAEAHAVSGRRHGGMHHIGRLAGELAELERALSIRAPIDEQTDDLALGYLGDAEAMPLRMLSTAART